MLTDRLQDLVDRISRHVAASAILEDRDFHLVAFASQSGGLDRVRQASILERRSTPEVRAWFEGFGIARSDRPVRIPADAGLGTLARVCLPARWNGVTYGYVWLLDEHGDMPEDLVNEVMHEASRAGAMLAQQARVREHAEHRLQNLLSPERPVAESAAEEISALGLLDRDQPVVAIVLETVHAADWRAAPLNMWRLPGDVLLASESDHISLLAPDTRDVPGLAARVRDLYAERLPAGARDGVLVGIGAPRDDLADARASWREARLAVRVSREVPALRPVATWNELGIYRLLACGPQRELRDAVIDPAVRRLLREPDGTLLATARAYLDHAGGVQPTAAELSIHRQTLYHRLAKIERLTGLDLADGRDRLRLHLGISLAPLIAGRQ
ncbi:PucR family transcriptional regulator [Hamadaea tsunoensis]|uniref:PucR family transcriptional regulator n=1 Tax=Hamadaea tsunoensis TaxID=53368 RepID=UPI00042260A5|nr:helix-turn-helix domain-containing protein [Hamadaea tsunoensis]